MKRLIPVLFIAAIGLLAFVHFRQPFSVAEPDISRSRVVVPTIDSGADVTETETDSASDDYVQESFITLASGETLITTVTLDIDSDGYEDQVNVLKTASSPYLVLVIALFNTATQRYDRNLTLPTTISQVRSFACTAMDVIGNHRSSIVYQGIAENGRSILQIYNGFRSERGTFNLVLIGDFEADGTIFIQQLDRDESYELLQSNGTSFPVWVYTSEPASKDNVVQDQVQTMYDWSEKEQMYVQVSQNRIAGSRIAEKELARIQDGTVATFAKFLDGLWYKTENTAGDSRYIFFDYGNAEVIFHQSDTEEVYSWQNSNVRHNGMYFSSVNKTIESLQRRVDITLVNINEIRVRIQDDVRMLISENTLWDGSYRKMDVVSAPAATIMPEAVQALLQGEHWVLSDGTNIYFDDVAYRVESARTVDNGRYMRFVVSGETLLQCRSLTATPFFAGVYSVSFAQIKDGSRTSDDRSTVLLQPVAVSPDGFYRKEVQPITLRRADAAQAQ